VVGLLSPVNLSSGSGEDRGDRSILVVLLVIGFASTYLRSYTDRIGFWTLDGNAIRWFGVGCSSQVVCFDFGRFSHSKNGSADWWQSNPDIVW
jgi:hypothetical protein